MGSWGTAPFDSDDFADMIGKVTDAVGKTLADVCTKLVTQGKRHIKNHPNDAWAAVGVVIWAYHTGMLVDPYNHVLDGAIELVETLKADPNWNATWRRGDNTKIEMSTDLRVAEEMLMDMRGRHLRPLLPSEAGKAFPVTPHRKRR